MTSCPLLFSGSICIWLQKEHMGHSVTATEGDDEGKGAKVEKLQENAV